MNPDPAMNLNRRPMLYAAATFAALVLFLILYWAAAAKRMVPGLNTPLGEALRLARATNTVALTNAPTPPAVRTQAKPPVELGQPPAETTPSSPEMATTTHRFDSPPGAKALAQDSTDQPKNRPAREEVDTKIRAGAKGANPPPVSRDPSLDDQQIARHWLRQTNDRPAVLVRYVAGDVAQLINWGRGLLVVTGGGGNNRRELYPSALPPQAPLYAKLTPAVAQRFSNFSLALNRSAAFAPLMAPLEAYFAGDQYDLAFVPDQALAEVIFSKVALASRSLPEGMGVSNRVIFEGQLRLDDGEPQFDVLQARNGAARHVFSGMENNNRGD